MEKRMAYNDIIKIVHDEAPSYISFLILLKFYFSNNSFFHILSFFFRFIGILILCANFSLKLNEVKNKSLSYYLRYFTSTKLIEITGINNKTYIIISFIIFILFCLRILIYIFLIKKLKHRQHLSDINLIFFRIINIFGHVVHLLFPFIIEFLALILFLYIFPNAFIFKKDVSNILNILVLIVNSLLILGYNINNYFFLKIINKPYDDYNYGIKYRYSSSKFWIIFLMQNVSLIQSVQMYFSNDNQVAIFSYIFLCIFCLLFLILFLISLRQYNHQNITNLFISIMTSFCFFSVLIKCFCSLSGYSFSTNYSIISVNILKIVVSIYFSFLNNSISNNILFKTATNELFKINKEISKMKIYDSFLYIIDILKEIKNNHKNTSTTKLLNFIFQHQNNCSLSNCKCKLIQIIPHGPEYDKNYSQNLLNRISFLIESAFIKLNFSENCDLCLILSEHFYYFKENPIMAYSLIQTLLLYNLDNLSISQILNCYEVSQKYIESMTNYNYRVKMLQKKKKINYDQIAHENLLESNFKEIFLIYEKIRKIQEIMDNYCQIIIDLIKKRNIVEETVKFKKTEDTGEILSINFTYLTEETIEEIIKILKNETNLNKDLFKEVNELKTAKFPMEFYYKIFLFWDTFIEGKIDEKLIPIFFSFTRDHNLYSTNINPKIFELLRQRYIELNEKEQNLYYCIFKYSKGMTITYFSEPLAQILGYTQSELIGSDIDILMPKEISKPHNNIILHNFIVQQNRVYKGINNKFFNKKGLLYNGTTNGAALLGLGKNILVLLNAKVIEKENEYIFYYNQNFDLISFSNSFGNRFSLDMDLIGKCNLNLLALFGINQDLLQKKLNEIKVNINKYKSYLNAMTEEFYSKKLYTHINKFNTVKYKLIEELENQNFDEGENNFINNKLLKAQRCLEHIYNNKFNNKIKSMKLKFKRPKFLILNNFDKLVNNNDKIDLNDKYYKSLLESFYLFQNKNAQNKQHINTSNIIYNILADIHILYDIPFITIKIKEEINYSLDKKDLIKEKPLIQANLNLNLDTNNGKISSNKQNKQELISQRSTTSISQFANVKIMDFQQKIKTEKNCLERYIKKIVVLSIVCVLVVYIIILIYQLNVIENIFNIFLAFYYNYIQRDKLVNLHGSLCSSYYYYSGMANYSEFISFNEYQNFIKNEAEKYSNSYHTFYQNYIKYRFAFGKDLSPFYFNYNFTKAYVSWDEFTYESNYLEESEAITYLSASCALNNNRQGILEDIHSFFDSNFTRYPRRFGSLYGQLLYYIDKNMQDIFVAFFKSIQDEIDEAQKNYSKKSRFLSTLIEILGFLLNLVTFISCIYFLKKTNINLYRSIINLFIDFTQEGNYSFGNSYNNFLLAERLNRLKFLLNNFSVKEIDKYDQKIKYGTVQNENDFEENDNNNYLSNKPDTSLKKPVENLFKKKKPKISKNTTVSNNTNENKNNFTNNNSLTITKSQNKLLNTLSVNLISKLNQNVTKDKSNINTSTKNELNDNTSTQNINTINNKKEDDEENILTKEIIFERLKILELNTIKFFLYSCYLLIVIMFIYLLIKLFQTYQHFSSTKNLFDDYSIVTFEYCMVKNYFNNLNLILVNQPMGKEDLLKGMQIRLEAQFKKSEEVKMKSIKSYERLNEILEALNNQKNTEKIKEFLCNNNELCLRVFDSKYNVFKKGIDIGLKTIAQGMYNMFEDFKTLKNELKSLDIVKKYFVNEDFLQIDLSLNILVEFIEEICADSFLIEAEKIIKSFKAIIISLNISVIIFLAIISICLIIFLINRITFLLRLIEKSTMRISISINSLKEKNDYKNKFGKLL